MENYTADFGLRPNPENAESTEAKICMLRQFFAYEHIKEYLSPESLTLELGAGVGYGAQILSQKAKQVIALDIEAEAVEYANARYGSDSCSFKTYDGYTVPYDDESFDVVIAIQVIEHVENETLFISEARRVLKKSGVFIVTTPNKTLRLKPGQKPWNPHHLREYTSDELSSLLKTEFPDVKIMGVRGNEEIQRIELARWNWSKGNALTGSLLSRLVPDNAKRLIKKLLRKPTTRQTSVLKSADCYSINDFYLTEQPHEGLDLIAFCRK